MSQYRRPHREFRHWSCILGAPAVRLSVADEHGSEYFMLVPKPQRGWAEERERLLDLIEEAIDAGLAPGEVIAT